MRPAEHRRAPDPPDVIVCLPDGKKLCFSSAFHIGRDEGCEVQIDDLQVSRRHAAVARTEGRWVIRDLRSGNGLFVNGSRVESAPVDGTLTVTLGKGGPQLLISGGTPQHAAHTARALTQKEVDVEEVAKRYFGAEEDPAVGHRTIMIRKAFRHVQQQQHRRTRWIVGALSTAVICAVAYAGYANYWMARYRQQAESAFYEMKSAEVGGLEGANADAVRAYRAKREELEKHYDEYIQRLYDRRLDEEDRLILRITRLFGECEVSAPAGYIDEVKKHLAQWRVRGGWATTVARAQSSGYTSQIAREFLAQDLPVQYFYLAMQESSFRENAVGVATRFGHAKGMWQFIADTAERYGLKTGRNGKGPGVDFEDERFNWNKATTAAARYIKDIYSTDAQASGLLVMASYNWGERRVVDRLNKLPKDPRERNFWNLLRNYPSDVPSETRNYVFRIVAAAVIGENPKLFGFQMENPLRPFDVPAEKRP